MLIREIDFNSISEYQKTKVIPVFMRYGEECFELLNNSKDEKNEWLIFQKIFYYKFYNQNREYIDSLVGETLFRTKTSDGMVIFYNGNLFPMYYLVNSNMVKFSENRYIQVMKSNYSNLVVLKKMVKERKLKDFQLFVTLLENKEDKELHTEINELKQNFKKIERPAYKIKKGKFVAGHINGLILNKYEKLNKYLNKEFDKKSLIGDISVSKEQEELINSIFKIELNALLKRDIEPSNKRVFIIALVRFAMRNYNKSHNGDFWPHFKKDFDMSININKQHVIHNFYEKFMKELDKFYYDEVTNKIDCITMHSFVADNANSQFFDFLFDFWRIDLERNVNNLYNGEDGKIAFNSLIDAIGKAQGSIMTHTSILLKSPRISGIFKSRIKRLLKLIDESFWNNIKINETGNRINHMLNEWIENPKGAFQKEMNYVSKFGTKERGEILFHTPIFNVNYQDEILKIILPYQRLIDCNEEDNLVWIIKCSNPEFITKEIKANEHYKHDKLGCYIEKMTIDVPLHLMLSGFDFSLMNGDRELRGYKIFKSNIRFFDENGKYIDHKSSIIPTGNVTVYSDSETYPNVLGEDYQNLKSDGLTMKCFNLIKGQIIIFDDLSGLQVGQNLTEGLNESYPISGAELINGEINYKIYANLPKLLFKADNKDLTGIGLIINNKQNRVVDKRYSEFKISADLKSVGYLVDLNDYISEEGLYKIILSYPKKHRQVEIGNLAYIKDFNYEFIDAPYIFEEYGTFSFGGNVRISKNKYKEYGIWTSYKGIDSFLFNFGERNENSEQYCKLVKDNKLVLDCSVGNKEYPIHFEIPALYWKFKENEKWNTMQPANIPLKDFKSRITKLYVNGPFNFMKSVITTTDDVDIAEEESEIKIVKSKTPYFEIGKIYNWFKNDRSENKRELLILLGEKEINLFNVICKSELKNVTLVGDFGNNLLKGSLEIEGNENYTISIYHKDKTICEDEQVINKQFTIETELESGDYEIYVYEIDEDSDDGDGFDMGTESILLNQRAIVKKLINLESLENQIIWLDGYQDIKQKYKPIEFKKEYIIIDLEKTSYLQFLKENPNSEIYGIWNENIDIYDDNQMNSFIYYKGKLGTKHMFEQGNDALMKVIVIFTDNTNQDSIIILAKDANGEDYGSLEINKEKGLIIPAYQYNKLTIFEKKKCDCFYDDQFYYLIDIEEE